MPTRSLAMTLSAASPSIESHMSTSQTRASLGGTGEDFVTLTGSLISICHFTPGLKKLGTFGARAALVRAAWEVVTQLANTAPNESNVGDNMVFFPMRLRCWNLSISTFHNTGLGVGRTSEAN